MNLRRTAALAAGVSLSLAYASTAFAAVNFKSGPTVTFSGNSATATAEMSGLGNTPAFATLQVNGVAQYTCVSPGGNEAPGQNPVPTSGTSGPVDLGNSTHNGRGSLNVTTTLNTPPTPTPRQAGCPNRNWTVTGPTLTVTSATLSITQAGTQIYCAVFFPNGSSTSC